MGTQIRKRPGPRPANRPKATAYPFALYPVDRAAIAWFRTQHQELSDSAALRSIIDTVMRDSLGPDWAEKVEAA